MREKAYLHIQRKVLAGEFAAGAVLSEASVARELGISRTPLREAIGQLVAEGYLRQIPNRGTIVADFSQRDIAELYELREALEVYAVGKAALTGLRPADAEVLSRLVADILQVREELEQSGKPHIAGELLQRFIQIDLGFHAVLLRAAGNSRIMKVVGDTRVLLNIFAMRRVGHDSARLVNIHRFHSEILDAVLRRDAGTAMRLLGEHIRVSRQERLEEYEDWERETAMRRVMPGLAESADGA
jgi:DNA-binding GntR family transcriptional regulator